MWSRPVGKGCPWRFCCHGKTCTAQRDRFFLPRTVESYANVSHPSTSANQLPVTRVLQPINCQSTKYFSQQAVSQPSTSSKQLSVTRVLQPMSCQSPEHLNQSERPNRTFPCEKPGGRLPHFPHKLKYSKGSKDWLIPKETCN